MVDPDTPLAELERQLADLKARWPAHSVPPSMLIELEELEQAIAALRGAEPEGR